MATSTSQDDHFYSAKRRLSRAKKHARDLESAGIAFINSDPYRRVVELDVNGITKLHKIRLTKPFPEELSDFATDAFDNLRSVLDHTAYASAVVKGISSPEYACFPFSNTAENWENRAKGLCKDIPSEIAALFRSFKPYKGGNDPLWGLNELRNVNQHAILSPLGTASVQVTFDKFFMQAPKDGSISFNLPMWNPITWDSCKNEMVIFREDPGGHLDYDFKLTPFIAFGDVPIFKGEPVLGVFSHLAREVESVLLATEAECRRIGLT